jgi:polyphenol oxidase
MGPLRLGSTPVFAWWTGAADGDQRAVLENGKAPPEPVPSGVIVAAVHQVHGDVVVVAGSDPPNVSSLPDGDAVLAADRVTCPAVLTADCVAIALGSPEGIRVAVHAGWRGLVAGVVERSAQAATRAGASTLVAAVGPTIGPCCYEFSPDDLKRVAQVLGQDVRATTSQGRPALDLRTAARNVLGGAGVTVEFEHPSCTACGSGWFSARRRKDLARQALYVWREQR